MCYTIFELPQALHPSVACLTLIYVVFDNVTSLELSILMIKITPPS